MQLVELAISTAVLEGRNEDGFGFQGDDSLDIGSHARTAIHDGILAEAFSAEAFPAKAFPAKAFPEEAFSEEAFPAEAALFLTSGILM